jgi:single-stranded-DNA-specific exonuclease
MDDPLVTYPPLEQALLRARGLSTKEEIDRFFDPSYEEDIKDPFGIIDLEKAAERIVRAIKSKEKIVIYGDYDCDGIPGSVVLHDLLKKIGHENFSNYIPHRHKEGYGLHLHAIEQFAKDGVSLIITVDNGITDVEEVARAQELGMDVIVTDHHLPQAVIPPAYAVVNSKRKEDTYHDNMLCGAGVAWKLACGVLKKDRFGVPDGWEKWLLDMVGISTIADMVPLQKENRALAHFGLRVLRKSPRPGLKKLLMLARADQRTLGEEDIGFTIAPRINAASRMDEPIRAFQLLSASDETRADELARHLTALNDDRKLSVARMMKEIRAHMKERELREVVVVGNPTWRIGIVGLAAGTLAEELGRPVFVWGREGGETIKGSCRSEGLTNMVDLMVGAGDALLERGGHEQAGGFSVSHEAIHTLEDRLVAAYRQIYPEGAPRAQKEDPRPDMELSVEEVNVELTRRLSRFAPFGIGNPKPLFVFRGVTVMDVRYFGKNKEHLELKLERVKGRPLSAIAFFAAHSLGKGRSPGERVHVFAHVEKNNTRFGDPVQLRIVDLKEA